MNTNTNRHGTIQLEPIAAHDPMILRCPTCAAELERVTAEQARDAAPNFPGWHGPCWVIEIAQPEAPGWAEATIITGNCPACSAALGAFNVEYGTPEDGEDAIERMRAAHHAQWHIGEWQLTRGRFRGHAIVENYFGPIEASRLEEAWALLAEILPDLPRPMPSAAA